MEHLGDLESKLAGKNVLVRLDVNVPIDADASEDVLSESIKAHPRIQNIVPTLEAILEHTHKVMIAAHLGRPCGKVVEGLSLRPVGAVLAELLDREVVLLDHYLDEPPALFLKTLSQRQILLLENLRFFPGEKTADRAFASHLCSGMDVYINDAFGVCHRVHASTVTIPQWLGKENSFAGAALVEEVRVLDGLLRAPASPLCVLMGGAKVSDKMGALLSVIDKARWVLLGGAMAYPFLQAQGYMKLPESTSAKELKDVELARMVLAHAKERHVELVLPQDHVVAREFSATATPCITQDSCIPEGMMGMDIGPQSCDLYASYISRAKTVLWNGPVGVCEWPSFAAGSLAMAQAIAQNSGITVVGGGDSLALVLKHGLASQITHLSCGGGAMLDYLEHRDLPALKELSPFRSFYGEL